MYQYINKETLRNEIFFTGYLYYMHNVISIFYKNHFKGWGRKRTGRFASWCYDMFGGKLALYEDGFIRSFGLGVEGYPSFSLVEDDVGIYYDATTPSKLENILNTYDFKLDTSLMQNSVEAMAVSVLGEMKYQEEMSEDGILLYDEDLVKPKKIRENIRVYTIPATRIAEELGRRIVANLVMLGFFTAITGIVSYEAMKKAIPGSVPERALELNLKAFERGYDSGLEVLKKQKKKED